MRRVADDRLQRVKQLVIRVELGEPGVRMRGAKIPRVFDRDNVIVNPVKDARRLHEIRLCRIAQRILDQPVVNTAHGARSVMKDFQILGRRRRGLLPPARGEAEGRSQQNEPRHLRVRRRVKRSQIPAHAGADQTRRFSSESPLDDRELARDRQMLEVTFVKHWNLQIDAVRSQRCSEGLSLTRTGAGGKSVNVEAAHFLSEES